MNWLGWSAWAIAAAVAGCVLGFFCYGWLLQWGWEAPWIVGLLAGAGAAAASPDRSVMRGLMIGTVATWTAAAAQVTYLSGGRGVGVVRGLLGFHDQLTWTRGASYLATATVSVLLGMTSLQRGARDRVLGT